MPRVTGGAVIRKRLKIIQRNTRAAISSELDDTAKDLLAVPILLAPQLTGAPIKSGGIDSESGKDFTRRSVFYTEDYAVIQHEGFFNPGPVTATKAGAGRKYLQRPFNAARREIPARIGRAVERSLRLTLR